MIVYLYKQCLFIEYGMTLTMAYKHFTLKFLNVNIKISDSYMLENIYKASI